MKTKPEDNKQKSFLSQTPEKEEIKVRNDTPIENTPFSPDNYNENLSRIYTEASQWLRMANTIVWSAGNILIPLSLAPFLVLVDKNLKLEFIILLALISVFLAVIWRLITDVYKESNGSAREILAGIEETWKIPEEMSYSKKQTEIIKSGQRITKIQNLYVICLSIIWVFVIIFLTSFRT